MLTQKDVLCIVVALCAFTTSVATAVEIESLNSPNDLQMDQKLEALQKQPGVVIVEDDRPDGKSGDVQYSMTVVTKPDDSRKVVYINEEAKASE